MSLSSDDLPQSPWTRFLVGFAFAAVVSFLGIFLYGHQSNSELLEAITVSSVFGLLVGCLSACGKKILQFFISLFTVFGF